MPSQSVSDDGSDRTGSECCNEQTLGDDACRQLTPLVSEDTTPSDVPPQSLIDAGTDSLGVAEHFFGGGNNAIEHRSSRAPDCEEVTHAVPPSATAMFTRPSSPAPPCADHVSECSTTVDATQPEQLRYSQSLEPFALEKGDACGVWAAWPLPIAVSDGRPLSQGSDDSTHSVSTAVASSSQRCSSLGEGSSSSSYACSSRSSNVSSCPGSPVISSNSNPSSANSSRSGSPARPCDGRYAHDSQHDVRLVSTTPPKLSTRFCTAAEAVTGPAEKFVVLPCTERQT